jgi:hypothetical protein
MESAIRGNLGRDRVVELDYQYKSLHKANINNRDFVKLNPEAYYLYNRSTNVAYKFNGIKFVRYKKLQELVYESDQIRKYNDFDKSIMNIPFLGTQITSTPGPHSDYIEDEDIGEEPELIERGKKKHKKEEPRKKLHFSIDQDDYKHYMKTKKPGKAFGAGSVT